jgi:uncharacterized protein
MYNKGDDTYLSQPKFMNKRIIDKLIDKIIKHIVTYKLEVFAIIFHGGEPLLWSKDMYEYFAKEIKLRNNTNAEIKLHLQTNGVLVDEDWINLFKKLNIKLGFSLDVTEDSNNKNRIYHNKKGSYDDIIRGYRLSKVKLENENSLIGFISVIDIETDTKEVYKHYKTINANLISLLLPDNTHDSFNHKGWCHE